LQITNHERDLSFGDGALRFRKPVCLIEEITGLLVGRIECGSFINPFWAWTRRRDLPPVKASGADRTTVMNAWTWRGSSTKYNAASANIAAPAHIIKTAEYLPNREDASLHLSMAIDGSEMTSRLVSKFGSNAMRSPICLVRSGRGSTPGSIGG
jgi:hypothetical protein